METDEDEFQTEEAQQANGRQGPMDQVLPGAARGRSGSMCSREVWRKSIQFSKTPLPDVRAENDLAGRVKKIPSRRRTGRTTVGVGCAITFLLMLGLDPRPI